MNEEERRGLANKFAKRFLDNLEERELCRKVNEIIDENIMLHSIIKEVREWATKTTFYFDFEEEITRHAFDLLYTEQGQELLKILDKVGDIK